MTKRKRTAKSKQGRDEMKAILKTIKRHPEFDRVQVAKSLGMIATRFNNVIHNFDEKGRLFDEIRSQEILKLKKKNQKLKADLEQALMINGL